MEAPEDIVHQFDMDPDDWRAIISRKKVAYADEALLEACRLVQKVHGAQKIENAVCKYYVAHDVFKLHPMDLHPLEDPFDNEYLLSERIRIANVIVECYSILEELHMQIKASRENPSVIDGRWDPKVKSELVERLQTKGIDTDKKIPWSTRNGVVRPFKTDVVNADDLCEWSDGAEICDFNISICDAILELSYMRSQLSSHSLGGNVLKLSVYDADNAFFLARYLVAKHLGRELITE